MIILVPLSLFQHFTLIFSNISHWFLAMNVETRNNILVGAIGVFPEEETAYSKVKNLTWILPTVVVIGSLIDALLAIAYMRFTHPWKHILFGHDIHEKNLEEGKYGFYITKLWWLLLIYILRHVPKSKNLGGRVVLRRAATARRRHLICQNLGGVCPPCLPLWNMPAYKKILARKAKFN